MTMTDTALQTPTAACATDALGLDPVALRKKYTLERDRRLRSDGNLQYVEIAGAFARYQDDPYVDPGFSRAAIVRDVEALVVGCGFGGLLAAAQLRAQGIDDLCLIERGGDFGGTWYWNR